MRIEYVEYGSGTGIRATLTGPSGTKRQVTANKTVTTWQPSVSGHAETKRKEEVLLRPLTLPDTFEIDLELASTRSPRFVMALGKDREAAEAEDSLCLETWDNELILAQDEVFETLP